MEPEKATAIVGPNRRVVENKTQTDS